MSTINIRGVAVEFPFEPYELQREYMDKVIECLQNETNGVLESPTGTGKTLSLLCSTLGWLQLKKAQIQAQRINSIAEEKQGFMGNLLKELTGKVDNGTANNADNSGRAFMGLPTIIYASRTHTQLSQAMNELKRSAYKHMKACIIGSREQMCIHPEVMKEQSNSARTQMCRLKVKSRNCHFHNRVERKKEDPVVSESPVMDIEDLVKLGNLHKFCPYYMAREIQKEADIIFMPYNYLLDPKVRKSLGIVLSNNVVILDEAHNIERICEEAASIQIKSTDVALAIEEVTAVMKLLSEDSTLSFDEGQKKDFTADELCVLKQVMLDFEAALDGVSMENEKEGASYPGTFIYGLFEKANINSGNFLEMVQLIDKICNFLAMSSGDGPFQRRGVGLELFSDLLTCTFQGTSKEMMEKVEKCFKVHVLVEQPFKKARDNWLSKSSAKPACRVLNYWCFSPGYGMNMLMNQGIRCVILTSGTLAPLKPLISELELKVDVKLENPHIVKGDQICVKIVPKGPDGVVLNGNFQNRDNPKYINSLGCTILNITRHVPDGLLIFFSSYPIMQKYRDFWQENGIWASICELKKIYVEPKDKEQFAHAMTEFYAKINDPQARGAIFMGVCRGKVSEGLDFADANGRAVIVTGLPYPPLKDPRIILKKRYLDRCNAQDKEFLKGDDWYSLEATRAVNQAIGRVIRHRHDYGAILLLDQRFDNFRIKGSLSMWLRDHIKVAANFGEIVRDLRMFFKNAGANLPAPKSRVVNNQPAEFETGNCYKKEGKNFQFEQQPEDGLVTIHKRANATDLINPAKKKKIVLKKNVPIAEQDSQSETKEFIALVKRKLDSESYKTLVQAMGMYRSEKNLENLKSEMDKIFLKTRSEAYLLNGLKKYIKPDHLEEFENYVKTLS